MVSKGSFKQGMTPLTHDVQATTALCTQQGAHVVCHMYHIKAGKALKISATLSTTQTSPGAASPLRPSLSSGKTRRGNAMLRTMQGSKRCFSDRPHKHTP